MHEMGIASSVIEAVREEITRHPGARASKVGLRLGEWCRRGCRVAAVLPGGSGEGTELEPLALDIDFRPRGSELDIAYLELED
jgi:hypothetical protein